MNDIEARRLLRALDSLLTECEQRYKLSNRSTYDAGRLDGVKWAIETISENIDLPKYHVVTREEYEQFFGPLPALMRLVSEAEFDEFLKDPCNKESGKS
jgi:hypothetical protein